MAYLTKNFSALQANFDARMVALRAELESIRVQMGAGSVQASRLLRVISACANADAVIVAHKAAVSGTAGFASYVAADKGVTTASLSSSINAVQTALAAARAAATSALPTGAGGLLLIASLSGGALVERTFTSAETAATQTALAAVAAEIA